jgi:phosphopantetheinyl transferase
MEKNRKLVENALNYSSDTMLRCPQRRGKNSCYADAQGFLADRALLRAALAQALSLWPQELVFCVGPFGEPALAGVTGRRVSFSFSRTCQMIAVALAPGTDIGVDVRGMR